MVSGSAADVEARAKVIKAISAVIGGFVAARVQTRWLPLAMARVWVAIQLTMFGSIGLTTVIACRVTLGAAEGPAYPVALHSLYKWFPDRLRTSRRGPKSSRP